MKSLMTLFLILLSACASISERRPAQNVLASRLNWGILFEPSAAGYNTQVAPNLKRVLEVANSSLSLDFVVLPVLDSQGKLDSDPSHVQASAAIKTFPLIFDLAVCARLADSPLKEKCLAKSDQVLLAWAQKYKPTGDPINEGNFSIVLQAIDLIAPVVSTEDRTILLNWVHSLADAGIKNFAESKLVTDHVHHTLWKSNWMAWSLLIRGLAGKICADSDLQKSTLQSLTSFTQNNLSSADGASFDFEHRDAFHYHIYDLLPMIYLSQAAPELVAEESATAIERSLQFIKPYFTGEKTHIEFVNTQVPFDIQRKNAGQKDYQNLPWDPTQARILFRLARPIYPSIRPWTENVVDPNFDPRIKLLAGIYGETSKMVK